MAQHYFSFERDLGGDWPAAVRRADAEVGYTTGRDGVINIAAGPALVVTKAIGSANNRLRVPVYASDVEILTKVRRCAQEAAAYTNSGGGVFFRAPDSGSPGDASYYVSLPSVALATTPSRRYLNLYRLQGGAQTLITQVAALTDYSDVWDRISRAVLIRARAAGTSIQARAWYEDEPEPSSWHISTTRPAGEVSGGSCGMLIFGNGSVTEWSFVGVGTNGNPAPSVPVPLPTISGKVNVDTPTGRPGQFTSIVDAVTGETWAVSGPDADGHWTASVPPGDYYLLYTEPDCQPLVNGPYHVEGARMWTPAALAVPPKVWLDWGSPLTQVSGAASSWGNAAGSLGGSFTQSTASNRPLVMADEINGRRVLRFDGSNDSLQASAPILTALNNVPAAWLLVVARKTAADAVPTSRRIAGFETASAGTARAILYWDDATVGGANRIVLGGRRLDNDAYYGAASAAPSYGEWRLIVGVVDYMERSLTLALDGAIDSVTTGAWTGAGNTSATNSRTANIGGGATAGPNFAGDIACVLAGSGSLSAEDRQRLEGWAAWECGLADNLSADHPYRHAPPMVE